MRAPRTVSFAATSKTGPARLIPFTVLAQLAPLATHELHLFVSVALTVTGPALHLYRPLHEMVVEERVKYRELTEMQARRQMRFYGFCATTITIVGVTLLTGLVIRALT